MYALVADESMIRCFIHMHMVLLFIINFIVRIQCSSSCIKKHMRMEYSASL